jgi:hypothetical protein
MRLIRAKGCAVQREDDEPRLFTVRIWSEDVDGVAEHRGQVRDVASGAFASFREWSHLTSFLAEQLDHHLPLTDEETHR